MSANADIYKAQIKNLTKQEVYVLARYFKLDQKRDDTRENNLKLILKDKPNYFEDLEVFVFFNLQKKNKEVFLGIAEDSASFLDICPISKPSGPKINF